jgi:hypothetical protein
MSPMLVPRPERVLARLQHIGVAREGVVAGARRHEGALVVGLVEEPDRILFAEGQEGSLTLLVGAGPELDVGQIDLVKGQARRLHDPRM